MDSDSCSQGVDRLFGAASLQKGGRALGNLVGSSRLRDLGLDFSDAGPHEHSQAEVIHRCPRARDDCIINARVMGWQYGKLSNDRFDILVKIRLFIE